MSKAVLLPVQPYWVFLIIAKAMGLDYPQEKTVEVRKNYPKSEDWNRIVKLYCSKNKKSLSRIPKEYQPLMKEFLGKVIGEFVCDNIDLYDFEWCDHPEIGISGDGGDNWYCISDTDLAKACLTITELKIYGQRQNLYGWHISNLKIYDKPKELSNFYNKHCNYFYNGCCCCTEFCQWQECLQEGAMLCVKSLTRAPQSWCYVEEVML